MARLQRKSLYDQIVILDEQIAKVQVKMDDLIRAARSIGTEEKRSSSGSAIWYDSGKRKIYWRYYDINYWLVIRKCKIAKRRTIVKSYNCMSFSYYGWFVFYRLKFYLENIFTICYTSRSCRVSTYRMQGYILAYVFLI